MSFYHPPLTMDQLMFAYPDEESLRCFFNETLGSDITEEPDSISGLGYALLFKLREISREHAEYFESVFCIDHMASNVAVFACFLEMKRHYKFSIDLETIHYPFSDTIVYENRFLALALTNDLVVEKNGTIVGYMDPESIGLIDAARKSVNQYRRFGMMISPINRVDDNLIALVSKAHKEEDPK